MHDDKTNEVMNEPSVRNSNRTKRASSDHGRAALIHHFDLGRDRQPREGESVLLLTLWRGQSGTTRHTHSTHLHPLGLSQIVEATEIAEEATAWEPS